MKKTLRLILILVPVFFAAASFAGTKRICAMTLNSEDEREALRDLYASEEVVITELVPRQSKNPLWLQNACRSGIECDVLVISGHFGGVFFGQGNSTTLDLAELERLSCSQTCSGILNKPKDIFLMGCNTLSRKTKDQRRPEEYVEVLIGNGFPRDLAERVAFSRYSDYGMSLRQIFASVFPQAERLHGFSSTGPLGKIAGPLLKKALNGTNADTFFAEGPDVKQMKKVFAGTSYHLVQPRSELDPFYKSLTCNSYSDDENQNLEAIKFLSKKLQLKKYYEPLLEATRNPSFLKILRESVSQSSEARSNFKNFFDEFLRAPNLPLKVKLQVIDLQNELGFIDSAKKQLQQESLIRLRLRQGLDFIATDQICSMRDFLKNTELRSDWLSKEDQGSSFLPRLSQCFGSYDAEVRSLLIGMVYGVDSAVRRESIRALKGQLYSQDFRELLQVSASWPRRDRFEMAYSLGVKDPQEWLSPRVDACLRAAQNGPTLSAREGSRWGCYEDLKIEIDSPLKCHQFARSFESESGTGVAWSCLKRFNVDIHLGACFESADYYTDPESSDDVRWYCWSKLSRLKMLSQSECLALAESMKIQGNRFKANWNCLNRL